ncbi:MAG: glycosyltransferase family 1 protein [Chloroflexi bacterium]|nr:glycosyltransferase family 1 protein [Chloroflexota bacterium]
MTKITLVAIGSRGDTQPYLALALGLQRAGYAVRLCAGDNFRDFVMGYGVEFMPVGVDIQHFINTRIPQVLESGRNTLAAIRTVLREGLAHADSMWAGIQAACEDADAIAANFLGVGAANIAAARGVPMFLLHSTPLIGKTWSAPPPTFPLRHTPGWMNALLHELTETLLKQGLRGMLNRWRAALNLAPLARWGWRFDALPEITIPMLYGHSPAVIARPADWPTHWHVTGFWFLETPETWQPPAALSAFLEGGTPPVYIGFGSMSGRKPEATTRLVLEALRISGQRGILATGWGGLAQSDLPDTVYALESVPHDWLFPRVAAVVHHGGAGTTAAGLRAGVPSIIIPHFGDQPFWGQQVKRLDVGVRPIPRKELTAARLAEALTQATGDVALRQRAAVLGERIRAEDGVQNAVQLIERYLQSAEQHKGYKRL